MVTQKFDLNMIPGKPKPIIRASQYDTGLRAFEVSLFAGTDTYTIPSGATLTVQGTKPDYTGFSYSATYSGNTVTFDCTDQMTACAGAVEMEIAVVNEGERVATANFVLQVEPAALKDDTIISETDIPIIEQLPEMMEDMGKLISTFGGPNVAETAAEMTDQDKVYVYIGSESGYNSGHWYYYDKTAHVWKDGGIYQSAGMDLDTTLSVSGKAADAKAVGDALALKANLASPTFTGYPKAPTASLISYGTQIANTEFVKRLVMPLDDAVNGLEPTEIEMHLVVDGTTGTWAQGGKTNIYDLLPGDNVEVTAGERDAYLVWYTTQGGSVAVNVSTSHTVTAGSTRQWGTTDARKLAVLMEDTSGNDVSPAVFNINGFNKGLVERVDELDADAKITGDAITDLKNEISVQNDIMLANAAPTNYGFVLGHIVNGTGEETDSTVRARTPDYIPYKNDEIALHIGSAYMVAVVYYDSAKAYKIGHWWYTGDYTVMGYSRDEILNTGYVRIVVKRVDDGDIDIDDLNANVRIGLKGNYKRTYTVAADGSGDFTSIVDAIYVATDHMDSTVYINAGVYDLLSDLGSSYINSISASNRGLYLKNRIRLIGSGDTVINCHYSGERELTARWLSIFNAGKYGFTIENLRLSAKNTRYVVHDERDSDTDSYINKYINCHMEFDNTENQYSRGVQCIGGGLGLYGVIVIDGCYFNSVNSQDTSWPAVSYHNSADVNGLNGQSLIIIKDSYFENNNTARINYYGKSTKITEALICNNSLGRDIISGAETTDGSSPNVNITVTKWNNRIRNMDGDGTITPASASISFDPNFSSLTAKNGIAILAFLINGVNLTTSNQHIATLSYKPTKRTTFVVYDKSSGSIAEGYVDLDGKLYSKAFAPLTGTNLRGSCSFVIA